ncbi:MAG: beta-lactamase family protein [Aureispira sp.]|nr:beta-lactamase family protein [Aureispira sp.]
MLKRLSLLILIVSLFGACQSSKNITRKSIDKIKDFDKLLNAVRIHYGMPAMAAAVIRNEEIVKTGVSGLRNIHSDQKVEITDYFHLGSNTKPVTAFWAAGMVEAGLVEWDTKFFDVFPKWKEDALKTYHNITLADLLSHRARIPKFTGARDFLDVPTFEGTSTEQRRSFAKWVLRHNPAKVGNQEGYEYSNAGYAMAATMLEEVSGTTWESSISEDVFAPMDSRCIVGWPTDLSQDQPMGHISANPLDTILRPLDGNWTYRMEKYIAPAGDISISIGDFAKFVQAHLQGVQGKDNHLKAETYKYMHYDRNNYGMGWIRMKKDDVNISLHDGSAGTFYSHTSIYKEKDLALIIFVNASNVNATKAVYTLKRRLMELYHAKK